MSGTIAEIELVVWDGLGDFPHWTLVEIPLRFRGTAGRGDGRRPPRLADMDENALNGRCVGDCGDQTHLVYLITNIDPFRAPLGYQCANSTRLGDAQMAASNAPARCRSMP